MPAANLATRPKDKPWRAFPDIPPTTYEKLRERAKKNFRTIRAEITAIVEEAINREEAHCTQELECK